jgi:hypothetical protein
MDMAIRFRRSAVGFWLLALVVACEEISAPGGALPVASIDLSSTSLAVGPALSATLVATPKAADGTTVTGKEIAWSTSDPAIATVSQAGSVTGVAFGVATVTASVDGKSAQASVSVVPTNAGHLAASWRMDSFSGKTVPAAYRLYFDEPVGDEIIAKVEIRLDSAHKIMTGAGTYQRQYCFTELHDDVAAYKYCWGDHGKFALSAQLPVSLTLTSEYIQNLFSAGIVAQDGRLTLNESLWVQEELHATVWVRR